MSTFWKTISATLAAAALGGLLIPTITAPAYHQPLGILVARLAVMAILVAVVWAILFRPQLERGRMSLFAILSLITLESLLLAVWTSRTLDRF